LGWACRSSWFMAAVQLVVRQAVLEIARSICNFLMDGYIFRPGFDSFS
jgi:hypothetical protein